MFPIATVATLKCLETIHESVQSPLVSAPESLHLIHLPVSQQSWNLVTMSPPWSLCSFLPTSLNMAVPSLHLSQTRLYIRLRSVTNFFKTLKLLQHFLRNCRTKARSSLEVPAHAQGAPGTGVPTPSSPCMLPLLEATITNQYPWTCGISLGIHPQREHLPSLLIAPQTGCGSVPTVGQAFPDQAGRQHAQAWPSVIVYERVKH